MPIVRPFRALRYAPDVVPELAAVVAPPYDVIDPNEHRRLLAKDLRNVVRLDFPISEPGDEPDERYRRAARLLSDWRSDGSLRRDPRPSLYAYEQVFRAPGDERERIRRGVFARVVLEAFGPEAGIRPHERTLTEPREDRYRLLRATGVNTSPVVGLYAEGSGRVAEWLEATASQEEPVAHVEDDGGVWHRLWRIAAGGEPDAVAEVCEVIGRHAITLADGHHRYETALRYRDERRTGAVAEGDPAWAEILMLLLEPRAGVLTVLPTHRVARDLGGEVLSGVLNRLPDLFDVRDGITREELATRFGAQALDRGGEGRFGLWTRDAGLLLHARRSAFQPRLPAGGAALRRLDVTLAGIALELLAEIDAEATQAGDRLVYTNDVAEAIAMVDDRRDGADLALLLEPTPAREIVAVAAEGDVMPQKSTYIYPKALTGLVLNPLE